MYHSILKPNNVHESIGYSHAARAGNTLYIAGQIARDRHGRLVGKDDIEAQVRQAYANLQNVLGEAGASLSNVVKMTTFLTDLVHIDAYRRVRDEIFAEPLPPNTLVVVKSLFSPEYLIEIEAIAVLDS